jgi:hypothetical protein
MIHYARDARDAFNRPYYVFERQAL